MGSICCLIQSSVLAAVIDGEPQPPVTLSKQSAVATVVPSVGLQSCKGVICIGDGVD